ncbi:hypothetical protein L1987_73963 [Smallanthus sonchifolius]|uniref:Uncharacterized protein n=1 Tax=Smallanthus sonchifolius TaxID=185202 RepID=A0ACB9A1N2_9ASTR|nr:hypothetical protein L1987_73963 [Smallanthus sonchifolius]
MLLLCWCIEGGMSSSKKCYSRTPTSNWVSVKLKNIKKFQDTRKIECEDHNLIGYEVFRFSADNELLGEPHIVKTDVTVQCFLISMSINEKKKNKLDVTYAIINLVEVALFKAIPKGSHDAVRVDSSHPISLKYECFFRVVQVELQYGGY